jgi:HEAT repeats
VLLIAGLVTLGAAQTVWAGAASAGRVSATASRRKAESEIVKSVRPALDAATLDKLRDLLAGSDPAAVVAATKALADSSAPNAALPLVEMLAVGVRPAAALSAIDALRKLRDPTSVEILTLYAGNRSADTRRHAVQALGGFADPRVVPILIERLGDSAPDVRGAAAEALGNRGDRTSAPRLLALLKRNDAGAAAPLGATAPLGLLPAIAETQGSIDDDNLASVLGEMLKRQDVPESIRVDIVRTLARVPGAASTTALIEYVGTLPSGDKRSSKAEAQKVIDERGKQK